MVLLTVAVLVGVGFAANDRFHTIDVGINVDVTRNDTVNNYYVNETMWAVGSNYIYNITSDGVGIGVETPSHRLAVVGDINVTNTTYTDAVELLDSGGNSDVIHNSTGSYYFNSTGSCMGRLHANNTHFIISSC
jgi:hypothetical protein